MLAGAGITVVGWVDRVGDIGSAVDAETVARATVDATGGARRLPARPVAQQARPVPRQWCPKARPCHTAVNALDAAACDWRCGRQPAERLLSNAPGGRAEVLQLLCAACRAWRPEAGVCARAADSQERANAEHAAG